MPNPYQPLFKYQLGTLAAQKRRTNTERERITQALALVTQAIAILAPLVQQTPPKECPPLYRIYAALVDGEEHLASHLAEAGTHTPGV